MGRLFTSHRGRWVLSLAVLVAATATLAAPRLARAAPPEQDWEREVRQEEESQDAQILKTSPNAVISRLESLVQRNPSPLNTYLLARAYGIAKRYDDAIPTYMDVLKGQPGFYFAHFGLAFAHREKRGLPLAEAALKQALALKPGYLKALRLLAQTEMEMGKFEEALAVLEQIVNLDTSDDPARVLIVEVCIRLGRADEALAALKIPLSKDPQNPTLRHMLGEVQALRKDWLASLATFRKLAEENPNRTAPFYKYLEVAERAEKAEGKPFLTRDEKLWALRALLRLETNEEMRKKIAAQIAFLEQPAEGTAPKGPPTPEQLIKLLSHPDPKAREAVLRWLLDPKTTQPLTQEVLVALLPRLAESSEPSKDIRRLALATIAKYGQASLTAIVRHSLRDTDPDVRLFAVDALVSLHSAAGIVALSTYARLVSLASKDEKTGQERPPDVGLPVFARNAIYALAGVPSPSGKDDSPEKQAEAFAAWWKSRESREPKQKAIAAIVESRDLLPHDLLFPLCLDSDPEVWPQAYRALKSMALGVKKTDADYDAWLRSIPQIPDDALVEPRHEADVDLLMPWWAKMPAGFR